MAADDHLLTGAYAIDAVEDEVQQAAFERHLAVCPECREEVRTLRETAALLAERVAEVPPAAVRARVLAQIATTPQLPPGRHPDQSGPRAAARRNRLLAAAASIVLLGGLGLGAAGVVQWQDARDARARAERILQIVGDPNAHRVSVPVNGGGTATVILAGSRAVLAINGMRALDSDRLYQLWLVRPAGTVSAGLGPHGRSAAGSWSREVDGVRAGDSIAISVEPLGGSHQPTTEPIAVIRA